MDPNLVANLKKVRKYFFVPIAVGFGISKREHLHALKPYADIAVVGSAIINIINKSKESDLENNVRDFISKLKMVK